MGEIVHLTFEERKEIEILLKKGATFPQIGTLIGRSKNTVRNDVRKFGKREDYDAKKAQALADSAPERRRKSLRKWIAQNKPKVTTTTLKKRQERISERVTILEEKINLILKILEKTNGKMH